MLFKVKSQCISSFKQKRGWNSTKPAKMMVDGALPAIIINKSRRSPKARPLYASPANNLTSLDPVD